MKIGYFADGVWAHRALESIIENQTIEIAFIVPRFTSECPQLAKYAQEYNIDYIRHKNINSDEFIDIASGYNCDLFVSMSFNQIFKSRIINLPAKKTINCHAGKLPFYRGRNILNWALINDEKEFGVTVHYMDEGIDTGDIILQNCYPISDADDYATLLERAYSGCADTLHEAIKLIKNNEAAPVKQTDIHPVGFYCGGRGIGDEILDINQSSREVFNFIRAVCPPGPSARAYVKGKEIKLNKARIVENAPAYKGIAGQVVGKTDNSFFMKTTDTFIEVTEYEYEGKILIGDRLTGEKDIYNS